MHRLVTLTITVLLLALAGVAVAVARDAARSFGGLLSRCLSRGPHARRRGAGRELRLAALVGLGLLLGAMVAVSGCSSSEPASGPQPGTQSRSAGATAPPIPPQPTATAAAAEPEAAIAESTSPDPAPATSPTSPPPSPATAARSPRVELPEAQRDESGGSTFLVAGRGGARPPGAGLTEEATTGAGGAASSFEQGTGPEYTWQDGDDTRTVRLQSSLTVTPGSRDDGRASVVPRSEQGAGAESLPVFRSGSGALMTLPGGILLLLDPDWDESRIDQFFADHRISRDRVSERAFGENAFFVETAPGFPALELANALAGQPGVLVSSPNWKREATLN